MDEFMPTRRAEEASIRPRRRFPIIWGIPLLAIAIAGWLAWDTLSKEGPTLTVSFTSAEGLQAGQSQLKFKDLTLGTVKTLRLSDDHSRVIATIGTTRDAAPLFNSNTVFWVVRPRLFAGSLSGLGTLISGSYVGMLPGSKSGKVQHSFVGLEDPPVLDTEVPGHTFLVKADRLGSISVGSPVFFRDLTVGQVLGWDLGNMASSATLHVFVREPFDAYVRDNSRFWNASGLNIKLGGAGIEVQVDSLRAILLGGVAFETPADAKTSPVSTDGHVFPLYASETIAASASYARKIPFIGYFPGSVKGLAAGSDVTFHGLKVGEVTSVALSYDHKTDAVLAPVKFEVQPERFLGVGRRAFTTPAEGVGDALSRGLHATLQSGSLITGQMEVTLDMSPDARPATLAMDGGAFVMPTTGSAGFEGLASAANELLNKVNAMPFAQIGSSLDGTLRALDTITNGPQLKQSLVSLAATMQTAQSTVHKLDQGMTPALQRLPEITASLQKTLTQTNKLMLSMDSGYGDQTTFNRNLERLMIQFGDAAQSMRALSDLLQRHPEALVRGRVDRGAE
jgi:paraquat-inducible protein B